MQDPGFTEKLLEYRDISNYPIYVGRHGQTVSNRDGRIMGNSDSPLTSHGLLQAAGLAEKLDGHGITSIYSSPLGRAALTASIYSRKISAPVHFRKSLSELACGDWEGQLRSAVTRDSKGLRTSWLERPPGGESYHDAEFRVSSFLQEIEAQKVRGGLLVIGHAGVNRVLMKVLLGMDPTRAMCVMFPHDLVYIIRDPGCVSYVTAIGSQGSGVLAEG